MALVKIKDVCLYVGLTENGSECFKVKKLLVDNNIPFKFLSYNDVSQHPSVFSALNTWRWNEDGETKTFNDFPIVHWKEVDDDAEYVLKCITSSKELNDSSLLLNKELVE